jgi:hypothetical protein
MFGDRSKYPPEMVERWKAGIAKGTLSIEAIMERTGISKANLQRKLEGTTHREKYAKTVAKD